MRSDMQVLGMACDAHGSGPSGGSSSAIVVPLFEAVALLTRRFSDTPQTLLDMISGELVKLGYEVWQPPLGGPGVVEHQRRPDLFQTPTPSTTCSTPASKHK